MVRSGAKPRDRKSDAGDRKSDAGDRKSDAGDRKSDAGVSNHAGLRPRLLSSRLWRAPRPGYAARTVARKRSTSVFSRLPSLASDCAEESTWPEAEPVSLAPRCTSVMLAWTCDVPSAA
jgi:hypothetical protein